MHDSAPPPGDSRLAPPRVRTLERWMRLSSSGHSLLRALQYEAITGVRLSRKVLDLGGDRRSGYHQLFDGDAEFETVNLNEVSLPTHVLNLEELLPFSSGSFSHVISLNTFEHVRNDERAILEAIRVLQPEGTFHFIVPFIYRIHGSPRDFHRHTPEWWTSLLEGFGVSDFRIEPLVWGPLSSAASIAGFGHFLRGIAMLLDLGIGSLKDLRSRLMFSVPEQSKRSEAWARGATNVALGFHVSGIKPADGLASSSLDIPTARASDHG